MTTEPLTRRRAAVIFGRYALATVLIVGTINAALLETKLSYPLVLADVDSKSSAGPGLHRMAPQWISDAIHCLNAVGIWVSEPWWGPIRPGTFNATWLPDVIFVVSGTLAWTMLVPVLALLVHAARWIIDRPDGKPAK